MPLERAEYAEVGFLFICENVWSTEYCSMKIGFAPVLVRVIGLCVQLHWCVGEVRFIFFQSL